MMKCIVKFGTGGVFALLMVSQVFGLDAEAINKLWAKEHDEKGLIDELKIFPIARKFNVKVTVHFPVAEKKGKNLVRKAKVVEKKYLVSETLIPMDKKGDEFRFTHVVTYSEKEKRYKLWTKMNLLINGESIVNVFESDGIYLKEKRVMSWVQVPNMEEPGRMSTGLVILSDTSEKWESYDYANGKLVTHLSGEDVAVIK